MSIVQTFKNTARLPLNFYAANFGLHAKNIETPHLWVLMYHRILPKKDSRYASEEPGMIVEPETFRMHLEWVNKLFTPIKLGDWMEKSQNGKALPKKACAITFDDGWLDNYEYAFPLLKQSNTPATVFAVSEMIGTNLSFWPNRFAKLTKLLDPQQLTEDPWIKKQDIPKNLQPREALATAIDKLKRRSDAEIIKEISRIEHDYKVQAADASLMNWHQLQEMSASGLVEIGSHTKNHMRLKDNLATETLVSEITESKVQLENKVQASIKLFCYPNGDVSKLALNTVKNTYQAAVTTQRGVNNSKDFSRFKIKRIPLHNDACNTPLKFKSRLASMF